MIKLLNTLKLVNIKSVVQVMYYNITQFTQKSQKKHSLHRANHWSLIAYLPRPMAQGVGDPNMYPSVLFPVFLPVFFTLHSHITLCWLRKSGEKSNSKHSWSCWTVGGVKNKRKTTFWPFIITGNNKPAPDFSSVCRNGPAHYLNLMI